MPILKPTQKPERKSVRISVDKTLFNKIQKYCQWAGIEVLDEYFEKSAEHVLLKDKDWKRYQKGVGQGRDSKLHISESSDS